MQVRPPGARAGSKAAARASQRPLPMSFASPAFAPAALATDSGWLDRQLPLCPFNGSPTMPRAFGCRLEFFGSTRSTGKLLQQKLLCRVLLALRLPIYVQQLPAAYGRDSLHL